MPDPRMADDIALLRSSGNFDAGWYLGRYPDVRLSGLGPEEHYLRYGFRMERDPGPDYSSVFNRLAHAGLQEWQEPITGLARLARENPSKKIAPDPRRVLHAAYSASRLSSADRAIALAERYLSPDHRHTLPILRANRAIAHGDEAGWLVGLNEYLERFGTHPVSLEGSGALFSRLATRALPEVTGGPLVSIIMPAWQAEATVGAAARSILNQTWRNLELLIVDDASTDGTWAELQRLAALDSRVRIHRNPVNVGPYVSKNTALTAARGDWITGHDSDDWAHPQRIERHLREVMSAPEPVRASFTYMIRLQPDGHFDTFSRISSFSPDGVTRLSSISALFERRLLVEELGAWDSVRFGADSEIIGRARRALGADFRQYDQIGMLCLSTETGLTNHPEHGVRTATGLSDIRSRYKAAWTAWHETLASGQLRLPAQQTNRPFEAPPDMVVPLADVQAVQAPDAFTRS